MELKDILKQGPDIKCESIKERAKLVKVLKSFKYVPQKTNIRDDGLYVIVCVNLLEYFFSNTDTSNIIGYGTIPASQFITSNS